MSVVILLYVMGDNQKKRIGELLIESGCLTQENLEEALQHQKKEGGMIGQILIRLGYISEDSLIAALSKQLHIPYLPLNQYSINMDAAGLLGEELCRRHLMLAFDFDDKKIYLALSDPLSDTLVDEIEKKVKLKPQVFISTPTEIYSMLDLIFSSAKKEMKKAS
jgi:type IV pilus assembly protein PilB